MASSLRHPLILHLGFNMALKQTVQRFLNQYNITDAPLLVALSGGPDSLALYHVLNQLNVSFAVAHVDHGWRNESASEAQRLKQYVTVPFHLLTLDPAEIEGNREDACRQRRLAFFKSLIQNEGYRAVLMGHHADDQAETVLKRIFEGACFTQMGAMEEEAQFEGMRIWRPFLTVSKRVILQYCEMHGLNPVDDYTNRDQHYLRARMRQTILPNLSATFGKEISKPLSRISLHSKELKDYLDSKVEQLIEKQEKIGDKWKLDLTENVHRVEVKHLLKKFLTSEAQIDTASDLIIQKKQDKCIGPLYIHMGSIFYEANPCGDIPILLREKETLEIKLTVDDE